MKHDMMMKLFLIKSSFMVQFIQQMIFLWKWIMKNFDRKIKYFFTKTRLFCEWIVPWNYICLETISSSCDTSCRCRYYFSFRPYKYFYIEKRMKYHMMMKLFVIECSFMVQFIQQIIFLRKWIMKNFERKIKYFFTMTRLFSEWIVPWNYI